MELIVKQTIEQVVERAMELVVTQTIGQVKERAIEQFVELAKDQVIVQLLVKVMVQTIESPRE